VDRILASKERLWAWKRAVVRRLAGLRLTIHAARAQVRPVSEEFPFLGFVVYPDRRRLKRRKGVAYGRKLRALVRDYGAGRVPLEQVTASARRRRVGPTTPVTATRWGCGGRSWEA